MSDTEVLSTVADLRRSIFEKGAATRDDFSRALAWGGPDSPEYAQLLADIAIDLAIDQADPPEYISSECAAWMIGEIKAHPLSYPTEMRLLTQCMHYAVSLPALLSHFCLQEIEAAIDSGRPGHPAGRLDADDVENLRRAVYATDENASMHVTRDEAETLFRIAHACAGRPVDPSFDEFFAKAVGNYLMGIAFHWTPKVSEEKQLEEFENSPAISTGEFFHEMFSHLRLPTLRDLENPYKVEDEEIRAEEEADDKERAQAEKIDPGETAWIVGHLTRDGELTSAERSLLAFLKQQAPNPPQGLSDLFRKAGV